MTGIYFCWGILYLQFGILGYTYKTYYDFNIEQTGSAFIAISVGAILMAIICIYQDKIWARYAPERLKTSPEQRLYFAYVESALMPIGVLWFGWTVSSDIPWIVPTLGVVCATMGIFSIFLAVFNYLADSYHAYASSAIAAQSCCRNLLGGAFPLFTEGMYKNLGYRRASGVLSGIGFALTLLPWLLVFYGVKIRARSKVASQIMDI